MRQPDNGLDIRKKIVWAMVVFGILLIVSTATYRFIGGPQYSLLDCLYMTMITISTVGFSEVIDLSDRPFGRLFTIFLALAGIGVFTYILSNFTASIVEGEINEAFRRRKMEKAIRRMRNHYIVCGVEGVGRHIISELHATQRPFVMVDSDPSTIEEILRVFPNQIFVEGDATDNAVQIKAGIENAEGIFAATGDDNDNLVITLTAKQLNPQAKVVTRCRDLRNLQKMRTAGADDVVFTTFLGGLRMASVMFRPTVVSFLDVMLRDDANLRVEEVPVQESLEGKALSDLQLARYPGILLLAVKRGERWLYNPRRDELIQSGDTLIFMATPEQRGNVETLFASL